MYPIEIEQNIINNLGYEELKRLLHESSTNNLYNVNSTHHKIAKYINDIVASYGKDPHNYEYKALLTGLAAEKNIEYIKIFSIPKIAKEFNLTQQSFEILQLIKLIQVVFRVHNKYEYQIENFNTDLIKKHFKNLSKILISLYENKLPPELLNNLSKASYFATFTQNPDNFNQYCNEVEILSCIISSTADLTRHLFLNIAELKEKVILSIAPKYGFYPECIANECSQQLSYSYLQPSTLFKELGKDENIKIFVDLINVEYQQGVGNNTELSTVASTKTRHLIRRLNGLSTTTPIMLKLLQKIFENKSYSQNTLYFINSQLNNNNDLEIYNEIKNQIIKLNTPEILKDIMNYNQVKTQLDGIIHLLASLNVELAIPIKYKINPQYYFHLYGNTEGNKLLNNVWSKLTEDVKKATMYIFIARTLGHTEQYAIPLSGDIKVRIKTRIRDEMFYSNNIQHNNKTLGIEMTEITCADKQLRQFMIYQIYSSPNFIIPSLSKLFNENEFREDGLAHKLLGEFNVDEIISNYSAGRLRASDLSFISMLKNVSERNPQTLLNNVINTEYIEAQR